MPQYGFNINTFKSQTEKTKYFQKQSKFLMRFPLPLGLTNKDDNLQKARSMEMWCESGVLPGVALGSHDGMRYTYGTREKRPFVPMFQDFTVSIISDGLGDNYRFLTSWIRLISNFDESESIVSATNDIRGFEQFPYELAYKYEYISDVEILVYRDDGKMVQNVVYRDAFPLMVADNRMHWATNGISKITAIFTYSDWFLKPVEQPTAGSSTTIPNGLNDEFRE